MHPWIRSGLALLALLSLSAADAAREAVDSRLQASREALQQAVRGQAQAVRPALLTREQLLRKPRNFDVQLAADGRHLSFRRRSEEGTALVLRDLANGRERTLVTEADNITLHWADDGRRMWLADRVGLAVFEIGDPSPRRIMKWDPRRQQQLWSAAAQAPRFAVIREQTSAQGQRRYRYLRVDAQGRTQLLFDGAQTLRDLLLHEDGRLAFSSGYEGPQFEMVVRRHDSASSPVIHRCGFTQRCRLLAHADDAASLYLLAPDADGLLALQRWRSGQTALERLHRHPEGLVDAAFPLWDAARGDWLAISYHPDRQRWHGRDTRIDAQLAALQRQLSGANLGIAVNRDARTWLVKASRADWPDPSYYLYAPATDRLQPLFADEPRPTSAEAVFSPTLPIHWRGSDGMLLHGYVTLPRGIDLKQSAVIALVHGGPYNRDRDAFDPLVQLLANRGHVVFQPNFRGSTGYGRRYLDAAGGEFGNGRVLADILDGLDFLLEQGIGDRRNQAMMGHSFGGYASLLGVSHRPERFRVAVASAAPVDLASSMRQLASEGGSGLPADGPSADILLPQFGMPFDDADWHARMRSESPLAQVSQLRTPLYLWAGAQDDRVALADIVRYRSDAMRLGPTPALLVDPDSGHNPDRELGVQGLFYLYELAAHRHLGSPLQAPSPELQRFIDRNMHDATR